MNVNISGQVKLEPAVNTKEDVKTFTKSRCTFKQCCLRLHSRTTIVKIKPWLERGKTQAASKILRRVLKDPKEDPK